MKISEAIGRTSELLNVPPCRNPQYERIPVPKELQEQVYEEQKGLCYLCEAATTVPRTHHITPDGPSIRDNARMLCPQCHDWIHWMLYKHLGYRKTIRFQGGRGYGDHY